VAYQDSNYNCFYFEAAIPEVLLSLECGASRLIAMEYDWRKDRFLLFADTGTVLVVSRYRD
jgi:hypothetical protein